LYAAISVHEQLIVNIHTHLIPLVHWLIRIATQGTDTPERAFMAFACLCLFSSAVWHTMSGCADRRGMELCARVDYVGIGWLIAASVGTVVYYGFQTDALARDVYLALCLLMGVTGSVFPFMAWFNMRKYKVRRPALPAGLPR
jgi:adiponectin receptor